MKNYIHLYASGLLYIAILIFLCNKARDIFCNSKKYNEIKGWYKYYHSFWYEPLTEYHTKLFAKNYIAPIIVGISLMILMVAAYYFIGIAIQRYLFLPTNAVLLESKGILIGVIAMQFLSIFLEGWIYFNASTPIMIACGRVMFHSKSRSGDWKS